MLARELCYQSQGRASVGFFFFIIIIFFLFIYFFFFRLVDICLNFVGGTKSIHVYLPLDFGGISLFY